MVLSCVLCCVTLSFHGLSYSFGMCSLLFSVFHLTPDLAPSQRAGNERAIVTYCNSIAVEDIESAGRAIQRMFNYTHKPSSYKTSEQTHVGTAASNPEGRNYRFMLTSNRRFMY